MARQDLPRMTGRQRLTMFVLLGATFMLAVNFSILNVALPRMGAAVGLGFSSLAWVTTAYALPAAGFTLLFGRIADLYGRRRMFLTGITLLVAASVLGGLATTPAVLLSARALQGFACAMAIPAALSLLITTFADERQRARVLGLNGALGASGFTVGALAGGTIVGTLNWRWAFLINVPVAVLVVVATPFVVRASRAPAGVKLDIPGAVTVTLGLLSFAFGITNRNLFALVGGIALLGLFWFIELRAKAPLAAVGILSKATVKWGSLAGLTTFAMEIGLIYLMTLYLQEVLHLSPLATGLAFGIPGLAAVAAGVVAGRVIGRHGSRTVLTLGLLGQAGLTAPLILLGTSKAWVWLVIPALFFGFFAFVTATVAFVVTVTSGLPDSEQGLATGLTSLIQEIGPIIGVPVLSTIAATQTTLLTGIHLAVVINVAATVTAVAFVWTGLRPRPAATSESRETVPVRMAA